MRVLLAVQVLAMLACKPQQGGQTEAAPPPLASQAPSGQPSSPSVVDTELDAQSQSVVFTRHTTAVGDKFHDETQVVGRMTGAVGQQSFVSVTHELTTRDAEILAMSEGVPTKLRLTYVEVTRSRNVDGADVQNPGPQAGRTYIVTRVGEQLSIDGADGGPAIDSERLEIKKTLPAFGKPDTFTQALVAKPHHVGDRLDEVAAAMKARAASDWAESDSPGDRVSANDVSVSLSRVEVRDGQRVAVLDVTSSISGVSRGAERKLETRGEMWVTVEGASVVRLRVEGTSEVSDPSMAARGETTITVTTTRLPQR